MANPEEMFTKAPHEAILDLPQERITGDILRGRGPRRGNLERLIKYWRPIMRKPGGFRRCLVILADHPELYPLERICAWLHHETTGQWPNEGNHHAGGKLGPIVKRTIKKRGRKRRGRKSFEVYAGADFSPDRIERRLAREVKSVRFDLLDGSEGQLEFKAQNSVVKRITSVVESILLPGEHGALKPRHILQGALTPGGSGLPGPGLRPSISGIRGRAGQGATRGFRCPPGFERGGHFTDSRMSTCGRQLFGIPGSGRSGLRTIGAANDRQAQVGQKAAEVPEAPTPGIGGGMPKLPETVGSADEAKQAEQLAKILASMSEVRDETDLPVRRLIREDGSILQPLAPLDVIGKQKGNVDLNNSALITRINGPGHFGKDEIALMPTGLRSINYSLPGGGSVSLTRAGGPMAPGKARAFGKAVAAASRMPEGEMDYAGLLRETAAKTDSVTYEVVLPGEENPTRMVGVTGEGGVKQVPYWVYKTFLAEGAPGKAEGMGEYSMSEEKSAPQSWGPLQYTAALIPDYDSPDHEIGVQFKAAAYNAYRREITFAFMEEKRASSVWDRGMARFRCPPGTTNGGQITNRLGIGCGQAVVERIAGLFGRADELTDSVPTPGRARAAVTPNDPTNVPGHVPGRRRRRQLNPDIADRIANALDPNDDSRTATLAPEAGQREERGGWMDRAINSLLDVADRVDVGGDELEDAVLDRRRNRDRERNDRDAEAVRQVEVRERAVVAAREATERRHAESVAREAEEAANEADLVERIDGPERDRSAEAYERGREAARLHAAEGYDDYTRGHLMDSDRLHSGDAAEYDRGYAADRSPESAVQRIATALEEDTLLPASFVDPFEARDRSLPSPRPVSGQIVDITDLSDDERQRLMLSTLAYREQVDSFWTGRVGPNPTVDDIDGYVRGQLQNEDILPGHRNTLIRRREDWANFQVAGDDEDSLLNVPNNIGGSVGRQVLGDAGVPYGRERSRRGEQDQVGQVLTTATPGNGLSQSTPEAPEVVSVATNEPWAPSPDLDRRQRIASATYADILAEAQRRFRSPEEARNAVVTSRQTLDHETRRFEGGLVDNPDDLLAALATANETHAQALVYVADGLNIEGINSSATGRSALPAIASMIPSRDETAGRYAHQAMEEYSESKNRAKEAMQSRGINVAANGPVSRVLYDADVTARTRRPLLRELDGLAAARTPTPQRPAPSGRRYEPKFGGSANPLWSISEDGSDVRMNSEGIGELYGLTEGAWGEVPGLRVSGDPDLELEVMYSLDQYGNITIFSRDKNDVGRNASVTLGLTRHREADGSFQGRLRIGANDASTTPNFQNQGVNEAVTMRLAYPAMSTGSVGQVDTFANKTIGVYAWASLGFDFSDGTTPTGVKTNSQSLVNFLNNPTDADARNGAMYLVQDALAISFGNVTPTQTDVADVLASYLLHKDDVVWTDSDGATHTLVQALDKIANVEYTEANAIAKVGYSLEYPTLGNHTKPFNPGKALFIGYTRSWVGSIKVPIEQYRSQIAASIVEGSVNG